MAKSAGRVWSRAAAPFSGDVNAGVEAAEILAEAGATLWTDRVLTGARQTIAPVGELRSSDQSGGVQILSHVADFVSVGARDRFALAGNER